MATSYSGSTGTSYASGKVSNKTKNNKKKYSKSYQESKNVKSAYNQLQNLQKPGAFSSQYEAQMNDFYDQYANRADFNFDVNESVLYEQLRDQYAALGKLSMQDTMGQAAAMTGGYGSSYAQTAGQQSYQNYMQQLQEQIPSLYQMEYDKYNQEGQNLLNQYNLAKAGYDTDYGEYRDSVNDYYTDRDYLRGVYQDERSFDYGTYQDARDYWTGEYWNEKNSAQTSKESSWSKSKDSSTSKKSSETKTEDTMSASFAPLSNEYVNKVATALNGKTDEEKLNYLMDLYDKGEIPGESQLIAFMDMFGLE